jgi:hypothetical protein
MYQARAVWCFVMARCCSSVLALYRYVIHYERFWQLVATARNQIVFVFERAMKRVIFSEESPTSFLYLHLQADRSTFVAKAIQAASGIVKGRQSGWMTIPKYFLASTCHKVASLLRSGRVGSTNFRESLLRRG